MSMTGHDSLPEGGFALLDQAVLHGIKELQGLLNGAIPPWAGPPLFPAHCQQLAMTPCDVSPQHLKDGTHMLQARQKGACRSFAGRKNNSQSNLKATS